MWASLAHYAAHTDQQPHRHDFAQVSFLLSGSMLERLEGCDFEMHQAAVGKKPAGSLHNDAWGKEGALIFSLKVSSVRLAAASRDSAPAWIPLGETRAVVQLVESFLLARNTASRGEAAGDLLAMLDDFEHDRCAVPPPWLISARARINDAPEIVAVEEVAREAGVHRSYLSRAFRQYFKVPPSVYRRQVLVARAVEAISHSDHGLSRVALDAGFCDQAHMNRNVKAQIGVSPGRLRRAMQ